MENILESKLNRLSLEELEAIDPNPLSVIYCHFASVKNLNKSHINILTEVARKLSLLDRKKPLNGAKIKNRIRYRKDRKVWIAVRTVNGVKYNIKQSPNKKIVEKAYKEFCKLHNID